MAKKLVKILASTFVGTSLMTVFSTLVSSRKNDFREPEQLKILIGRLLPLLNKEQKYAAGWAAHYLMGAVFSAIYVQLWDKRQLRPNLLNGVILGALSGVIGAGIWKATFKAHPFPQIKHYQTFYWQRIPAHLVFAIFATLGYILVTSRHFQLKNGKSQPELAALKNQTDPHLIEASK